MQAALGRGFWSWASLLLALVSLAKSAHAQSSDSVLLSVAAPEVEAEALRAVVDELLERLAMHVELRRVAHIELQEIRQAPTTGSHYFARAWVGFAPSGGARLYLEHSATDRVLVRDVNNDAQNPELVREELGHILQSALEGWRAGEPIGAPRREALRAAGDEPPAAQPVRPAAASPTDAPAAERRSHAWRFGPRYELAWLGDSRFEDGPGAIFGFALPDSGRFGLELGGYFRRPVRIDTAPVGARLQALAFTALATFDAWRGPSARLRLGVGAEADLVRVSPFATSGSSAQLASSHWLKLALGRLALTYAHELGRSMDVELTLGAVLDPSGTRYVVQGDTGETRVLTPWPVRPLIAVGVTVP